MEQSNRLIVFATTTKPVSKNGSNINNIPSIFLIETENDSFHYLYNFEISHLTPYPCPIYIGPVASSSSMQLSYYLLPSNLILLSGRWLTTFQATWHPTMDIFCSGSMNRPRCMEVFDSQGRLLRQVMGESLGSVMSRTCFHSSTDKLIMVGGNSSGRMVAIR